MNESKELLEILVKRFDIEELKTLCFNLNIHYDDLRGETLTGKARELVSYCERVGRISDLKSEITRQRPQILWFNESSQESPENSPENETLTAKLRRIGRYEILEGLGRGGFATVFKARDTRLNRLVALKVLHAGWSHDPEFVRRFYREAETAAQFSHPNIVRIYDVGEIEGQLFISMEYLPGQNLQQWLDEKGQPLTVAEALPILQPLATALDYAHKQGVVHLDFKPGNIMINGLDGEFRVTLTDFGLATAMEESDSLKTLDRTVGTPAYMAPEQTDPNRYQEVGPHTDRYAFGILVYQMLAGRVPFRGNPLSILNAQANLRIPSPKQYNPALSKNVVTQLFKMTAKKPADRFPTATASTEALKKSLAQSNVTLAFLEQVKRPDRKLNIQKIKALPNYVWAVSSIVGILLLAIMLLSLFSLLQNHENPTREIETTITTISEHEAGTDESITFIESLLTSTSTLAPTDIASTLGSTPTLIPTRTPSVTPTRTPIPPPPLSTQTLPPVLTPFPTVAPTNQPPPPALTATEPPLPTQPPLSDPLILPLNPTLGITWTRPSDNMVMVYVPPGTFIMGSNPEIDPDAQENEQPQHDVTLDSFWIDRTEVTNEQYALCVQEGSCDVSLYADDSNYNDDTQPVVGIYWFHAQTYCAWAGGDLPTEAQWEYAARWDDGRLYPWGNEAPTCELAQSSNCGGVSVAVGSFSPAGDSWVGAADMAGNVWEWVADWYSSDYYANSPDTNPTGPEDSGIKVLRGGGWSNVAVYMRSATRGPSNPSGRAGFIGFRCAAASQ